ncbi:hypothetical protein PR048_024367 [Dryococelus australis]|uniref:Uncharacterized protein n=1 Tax=Dryococelus australis TaxID=614101 RepID=A0ABQ9GNG2_9NEOP|nr:hypothetical protein PR048_024367 [Dryococelus australis]
MSGDEDKSEDKKEIEDEEREKILNEENKREQDGEQQPEGEVQKMRKALEECEKDRDGKKKVPIGGIKIPGFLKSKSRDKCKVK